MSGSVRRALVEERKRRGGRREGEMQFAKCSVTYIPNGYFIKRYAMQRR